MCDHNKKTIANKWPWIIKYHIFILHAMPFVFHMALFVGRLLQFLFSHGTICDQATLTSMLRHYCIMALCKYLTSYMVFFLIPDQYSVLSITSPMQTRKKIPAHHLGGVMFLCRPKGNQEPILKAIGPFATN